MDNENIVVLLTAEDEVEYIVLDDTDYVMQIEKLLGGELFFMEAIDGFLAFNRDAKLQKLPFNEGASVSTGCAVYGNMVHIPDSVYRKGITNGKEN